MQIMSHASPVGLLSHKHCLQWYTVLSGRFLVFCMFPQWHSRYHFPQVVQQKATFISVFLFSSSAFPLFLVSRLLYGVYKICYCWLPPDMVWASRCQLCQHMLYCWCEQYSCCVVLLCIIISFYRSHIIQLGTPYAATPFVWLERRRKGEFTSYLQFCIV